MQNHKQRKIHNSYISLVWTKYGSNIDNDVLENVSNANILCLRMPIYPFENHKRKPRTRQKNIIKTYSNHNTRFFNPLLLLRICYIRIRRYALYNDKKQKN